MKRIMKQWLAALLLPLALGACQKDDITTDNTSDAAGEPLTVRATIGTDPQSRAQVKWGNEDATKGELFMWNTGDTFKVYDLTDGSIAAQTFTISDDYDENAPSASADFTAPTGATFTPEHTLVAFYGDATPTADAEGLAFPYQRPAALTQTQTATPGNADLAHLKDALRMVALSTVDAQGKPGPFHFDHVSSLIRITVTNTSGAAKQIKRAECTYGVNNAVVMDQMELKFLKEGYQSFGTTSATTASTIDLRAADGDAYATIAHGTSYDIFIPEIFSIWAEAQSVTITLTYSDDTRQSVTIAGLKEQPLEWGYRYWFDLTIDADGLRQTSREPYAWYKNPDPSTNAYLLATPTELREFAALVNGDAEALTATNRTGAVDFSGKTVRIADGITTLDLGDKEWTPIGTESSPFKGTFDGNGATVSGLNVNVSSGDNIGFFGYIKAATVSNLRVTGNITAEASTSVGGIAGSIWSGSVINNCLFDGTLKGKSDVGGIAGYSSYSPITACFSSGSVEATSYYAGGIVGENLGTITHCYSSATVTAVINAGGIIGTNDMGPSPDNTVSSCYATGMVSATNYAGGITGYNNVILTDCLALGSAVTRTDTGTDTYFGRVAGYFNAGPNVILTNCAAYDAMTLPNGIDVTADSGGKHGADLTADECKKKATYTDTRGFDTTLWGFEGNTFTTYLPWLKVLYDYWGDAARIPVPDHLLPK